MPDRIALLGWGSLVWDSRPEFDAHHSEWQHPGPCLPIEFSRISTSRKGALTLVIDCQNGTPTEVSYCFSYRNNVDDAIEDLRKREGTTRRNIGAVKFGDPNHPEEESAVGKIIREWAFAREASAVVWTNLSSNFSGKTGQTFSVANAIAYLTGLEDGSRQDAREYIRKAPEFVQTPLRDEVATSGLFDGDI